MAEYEQLLSIIGEVVAYGGGATTIAFLTFRFLGKAWIENKFSQRLEHHKHLQALEIQRLRVEIDSMLSGALKIQEREFTLLPEAWAKLDEAYNRVAGLVSPFQTVADVSRMNETELEYFLSNSKYDEYEKNKIRTAQQTERAKEYDEIEFWHRKKDVKHSIAEFHNFVVRNSIFFPDDINNNITTISNLLWSAVVDKEIGREAQDYKIQNQGWRKIKEDIDPLYKSIQASIRNRLQSHSKDKECSQDD